MKINRIYVLTILFCGSIFYFTYNKDVYVPKNQVSARKLKEKKRADKPGDLMRYLTEIRTREGAKYPVLTPGYRSQALREMRKQQARNGNARTKSITFTSRGPGNVPGRTRAIYNLPDASFNTYLVGAATGGIWRTTNGGQTWTEKNEDLNAYPVSSFAGNKTSTRVYAATGEYVSTNFSAIGDGIYVSTDQGQTWAPLTSTQNNDNFLIVTRIIVNPDNGNEILATTINSDLSRAPLVSRVMRSTDGGNTWTKVLEINGALEQIIATPGNFQVQYAAENSVGVWKSINGGVTWNLSNSGMLPTSRIEIAVSPVNPQKVFVSAVGDYSGSGSDLYVSTDAGTSWGLASVKIGTADVDFLGGQGFYDNTILCDPFNENIVYVGGVSLFRVTLSNQSGVIPFYSLEEINSSSFLFLQAFTNIPYADQRLDSGSDTNLQDVEVRFGPGQSQKAHQFFVPTGATSGVAAANYTYQNYVDVPFTVWDVSNSSSPRQLMVSFRDQNRNGFDLVPQKLAATDAADEHSREYLYIHNIDYSNTSSTSIATAGGHEFKKMYGIFPALASGATWSPGSLPTSTISISSESLPKYNTTTITSADAYNAFDGKNVMDQVNLTLGVHADHHFMVAVVTNETAKTYKILLGNDGGFFVSNDGTEPGTTQNSWSFRGTGLNTSQFYGADKRPGADEYIGGMQDNGTRKSAEGTVASTNSNYTYMIGGDGFEVVWNSLDAKKILGSIYYGDIRKSLDGGATWTSAANGFTPGNSFPFITRIANSRAYPDRVFTVSAAGVHKSDNFGNSWTLTAIPNNFAPFGGFALNVEVSRANANIIWAGGGMRSSTNLQYLHVSTNGGATFSPTTNYTTASMGTISGLATHPTEPNTAYALFGILDGPKILRTTNLGQTWTDISGFNANQTSSNGFPDVGVFCLYVHPDTPQTLWAGTEIGIVESTDNGASWHLLDQFPNVPVWSMVAQDDEIVIATHGRGIWTAETGAAQTGTNLPVLTTLGTAPNKRLMARISLPTDFDKVDFYVGGNLAGSITDLETGTYDVGISGIGSGSRTVYAIAFRNGAPFQTATLTTDKFNLTDPVTSYLSYFEIPQDFILSGLTLQYFEGETNTRRVYQSQHPYDNSRNHSLVLRKPVIVGNSNTTVSYADVAIIQPDKDQARLEATANGLDWITMSGPYDASDFPAWSAAYTNGTTASRSMARDYTVDLSDHFDAGDTVILRWKMTSDASVSSWGYALMYIAAQDAPLAIESDLIKDVTVSPNPSAGPITVRYSLSKPSASQVRLIGPDGKIIKRVDLEASTGNREVTLDLPTPTGLYLVQIRSGATTRVVKVVRE